MNGACRGVSFRDPSDQNCSVTGTIVTMNSSILKLDDPELDEDHAVFQQLILSLLMSPRGETIQALDALRTHASSHFSTEDADLRRLGGSNAHCHLDEHAAVLRSLEEVRAVVSSRRLEHHVEARLVDSLANELLHWLPAHVQEMDAAVAQQRSKERWGGAPLQFLSGNRKLS